AIATSVAAWMNTALLAMTLLARGWYTPGPRLVSGVVRAALATAIMSAAVWFMLQNLPEIRAELWDSRIASAAAIVFAGGV
ncbi:MAG TPA: murein biosynthesis integral membrane protein MurJ, partial [Hyphomonas atlantica]|nr:murein biosynthesis integral membrane protein MurJ [Hyphomonas atlantica]